MMTWSQFFKSVTSWHRNIILSKAMKDRMSKIFGEKGGMLMKSLGTLPVHAKIVIKAMGQKGH